ERRVLEHQLRAHRARELCDSDVSACAQVEHRLDLIHGPFGPLVLSVGPLRPPREEAPHLERLLDPLAEDLGVKEGPFKPAWALAQQRNRARSPEKRSRRPGLPPRKNQMPGDSGSRLD